MKLTSAPLQLSSVSNSDAVGILSHSTVISAGVDANVGAPSSPTVMTCVAVITLPQTSVAVHVRVMICPQLSASVVSANSIVTSSSQLSIAVTTPSAGAAGIVLQSASTSVGTPANVGASLSVNVSICVAVAAFPQLSVAVHVRVIVCSQPFSALVSANSITTSVSQLSVAVITPSTGAAGILAQSTVASAGIPANSGAVVSCTKIVCVAIFALPQSSLAVQVRVIV